MIWPQILSALLEVSWSVCVFVCIPSKNEQCSPVSASSSAIIFAFLPHRQSSLLYRLLLYLSILYTIPTILFYCSPTRSPSLPLSPQAHIFSLFSTCCITVVPCTLLPLSHVCHSLSSVTIQQLCPDFSEALGSKIQYLPGQTENQYPPNANTAHRQFGRSANDAGSCTATEFSDYRAETTKRKNILWLYQIH